LSNEVAAALPSAVRTKEQDMVSTGKFHTSNYLALIGVPNLVYRHARAPSIRATIQSRSRGISNRAII
jgi:hypothetical protein